MAETYMILIVEGAWDPEEYSAEDFSAEGDKHRAFAEAVAAAGGRILDSDALQPYDQAVRIEPGAPGDEPVYTDGPFPEVKEFVTGYYKIEAPDLATARRVAALCPTGGHLELVPVFDTSQM